MNFATHFPEVAFQAYERLHADDDAVTVVPHFALQFGAKHLDCAASTVAQSIFDVGIRFRRKHDSQKEDHHNLDEINK